MTSFTTLQGDPTTNTVWPGRGVSYVCLRNRCLDTGVLHVVRHASESVSPPVVGIRFGYTRVSTVAQALHQQHDALKAAGASKIYSDTMSGARDDRPGLAALRPTGAKPRRERD
jgi:Resolvase, N terminal domain